MKILPFILLLLMQAPCVNKVDEKKIMSIDSLVSSIQANPDLKIMSIDGFKEDGTVGITHKDYFTETPRLLVKTVDIVFGDSTVITSSYFNINKLIFVNVKYEKQTLQKVYFEDSIVLYNSNSNDVKTLRETSNYYLKTFNDFKGY